MKNIINIKNIYFFSAICIFIYLILRAIYVPPVHDEAATFMHYVQRNEWMPFKAMWDANNHILNSFLSARIFKICGQDIFYLRLASLLFFPVYVWYTYKISGFLKSNIVKIGFLCGMLGVHHLIVFFAYSRGYAMSMALLMASIFYVLKYFESFDLKKLAPFYFFSTLAIVANLTLFNTIVILNGILFLSFILKNKKCPPGSAVRTGLLKFLYSLVGLALIIGAAILSMTMKNMGLLYYGTDEGFYALTVWSLVILIYDEWIPAIGIFFTVLSAMAVIFLGAAKFPEGIKKVIFTNRWLFTILFLGNILATILLQKIVGVNYPEDRTAMYFYFFLVLFFCFALDAVSIRQLKLLALVWIVMPIHFLFSINLTHSSYWWYEHIPNSFYKEIEKRAGEHPEQVSIGGYALMDMIWAYYNHKAGGKLNDIQTADYPSFYYDYLLLYDDNNNAYAQDYYNVLIESPISHIRVLERKEKVKLHFLLEQKIPDQTGSWAEYIPFFENDTLLGYKNLCFDFSTHFQNKENFFLGGFTLRTDEPDGTVKNYEYQLFHLTRTEWKQGGDFHHRIYVHKLSPGYKKLLLYFWNPRKRQVWLSNNSVKVYYWE